MNNCPHIRLGEIATGTSLRNKSQALPVYAVTKHQGFVLNSEYFKKSTHSKDTSKYKVAKKGHFAYATIHLDEGSIGIAPEDAAISPMYTTFKVDESRVSPDFLVRYLKSENALAQYSILGKGSAERRRSISFKSLQELIVPLPPLDEQRRIADILDKCASQIDEHRRILGLTRAIELIPQSIREKASGPDQTSLRQLGAKIQVGKSVTGSGNNAHMKNKVIKVSAVSSGNFISTESKPLPSDYSPPESHLIRDGDLLFARASGSTNLLGASCIAREVPSHTYLPDKVWRITNIPQEIPTAAMLEILRSNEFRNYIEHNHSGAAGVKNVRKDTLLDYRFAFPCLEAVHNLKNAYGNIVRIQTKSEGKAQLLTELYNSLATRAFAGEL